MKILPTALRDVFVIEPDRHEDERGGFVRTYCQREFASAGLNTAWVQTNRSFNRKAGTLRGLHYQAAPHGEVKLVTCLSGAVLDVAVDIRPGSETFGQHVAVELSAENGRALYLGLGQAHGFQTLTDEAGVLYQMGTFYEPSAVRGLRWDCPDLAIDWPVADERTMSDRDRQWPTLREAFADAAAGAGISANY